MSENCQKSRKGNVVSTTEEVHDNTEAIMQDKKCEAVQTCERRRDSFSDPICIDTKQIYDSCRDRDCILNGRVYTTEADQTTIESATNVKLRSAEIIWVYSDIEPLPFNNGCYSIDLKFYICVTLDVFSGVCNPTTIRGLTMYDKRVILHGSEGSTKIFKSDSNLGNTSDLSTTWQSTGLPTVVVETVNPVALGAKLKDSCCCEGCNDDATTDVCTENIFPEGISSCFEGSLLVSDCIKHIEVSYGLFSMIRLERDSQLLIDAVDFCIPTKECPSSTDSSPCELFDGIRFPVDEFFPPQKPVSSCYCDKKC